MNEGLRVYQKLSAAQREDRLQRSGLEALLTQGGSSGTGENTYGMAPGENLYSQYYRVLVFNLTVLEIRPLGTGAAMNPASLPPVKGTVTAGRLGTSGMDEGRAAYPVSSGHRRGAAGKLRDTAVKALYCLGLDSGELLLKAMGGRRYRVDKVTPLPAAASGALPEPYRAASLALTRSLALEQPGRPGLLLGMDPEFLLLRESTGRVVPASRYLPTDGVAGCDAGPPGTRGTFPVAELRPAPRGEPRALLAQLMSAARTADRLIADRSLRWRAGGMPLAGWALGGHLHFSGVALCAPLLRTLDNYLALPLMLLEDARAAARRPRYGGLGDFRLQPHGGFEYRTLPSFLVSPVIAKGAVFLAHLIVSRYEDLRLRPFDRDDLHAAYYSGDKSPLRAVFPPLAAQIRALPGYGQAARYIEPLFSSIAAEQTWDESRDIRGLWCGKKHL
ncbi:hypothetical protein A3842_29835 [Paenibacillus sp. P3E]|uniref:putative amidoligase domain-containing protein n=1 Tax=Paenibacillus sp. P3E TaxID=1349435 RepID=UPI00093DD4D0|nr:hypothetical protein [Paenibacillus sp. P3E]OKP66170.1 hypothetical protein A3842_29835 [Paenibacillus sp. P3E]